MHTAIQNQDPSHYSINGFGDIVAINSFATDGGIESLRINDYENFIQTDAAINPGNREDH